jgi:hypothetical protein
MSLPIPRTPPHWRWQENPFLFGQSFDSQPERVPIGGHWDYRKFQQFPFEIFLCAPGVFDVNAMSMFITNNLISEKYLVCLLNSYTIFLYKRNFINNTSAFQINDARQLPIVIPTSTQLAKFESLFDRAVEVKKAQYSNALTNEELNSNLKDIQIELDDMTATLYGIPNFSKLKNTHDTR